MKQLSRLNFGIHAIVLITLTFLGCTKKPTDFIVDLKTQGQYEINFDSAQNSLKSKSMINHTSQENIKLADIEKNKLSKEFHTIDNFSNLTIAMNEKRDSIDSNVKIETTIYLDTVVFNGSPKNVENDGINHSFKGHSKHEITKIVEKKDTLNQVVTTTFDFTLNGEIKGKGNDLLINYLIEKELLSVYLPDILKAIKDRN